MKITLKQTTERQVEIPVPSFWKDNIGTLKDYVAVLDEETFVNVWVTDDYSRLTNGNTEIFKGDIVRAYEKYELCSEEEFFAEFEKAYKSLSLSPSLISVPDMGPWNEHLKEV